MQFHKNALPLSSSASAKEATSSSRSEMWALGGLLLAGLLLRLVLLWRFAGIAPAIHDERDYDQLAVSIAVDGEYAFAGNPTSIRPPLYPTFLAAIYRLCGVQNYQAVRLVQILLSLVTVVVVYLLARNLYDRRVGLCAAAIVCFYPSLMAANNLILTETLFTLLVCLFVLLIERYFASTRRGTLAAAGVVLGLAALTRSALWLFPPVAILFLLLWGRERTWSARLVSGAVLLLGFVVTLAPWTIRNTRLQHTFTTVDVMGGRNLMMGNYEHTPAYRPWAAIEMEGEQAWHKVLSRHHGGLAGKTQGQIDKLAMRYAIEYVLAHPGQTIQRSTAKLFHFWQLERELIAGARRKLWGEFSLPVVLAMAVVILGSYVVTMVLGIFGAVMAPPKNLVVHGFLLLLIAYLTALHSLAFGHSRYHLPLMPLVIVYAAAAWSNRGVLLQSWRSWPSLAASTVVLVLAISWVWDAVSELGRF